MGGAVQETEPTSTRSGLRFGKFSSTKLLCVFLTVVLDAAAIPVNDGSSNVMPDVTAIDPMPEPKNSGLLFASPDRHPTFAPRPTPPVPNLKYSLGQVYEFKLRAGPQAHRHRKD